MVEFNSSLEEHISENMTCGNGTCSEPVPDLPQLRWWLFSLIGLIVCTAIGNLLVCLAVCWDRRLQNMTNYFLMSLAIADFLVSILVMPFGMLVEVHGYFPLQGEFCALWVTMDVLMCTASIWHMCTMSMDRYFTLKYPMQYGRNKTKTMVALKITFVWAISIAISSPICIYGFVDHSVVLNDGLCVPTLQEFVIYGSVFAFCIPLSIMVLTYFLTTRILWKNQNLMRTIDRSDFRMLPRHRGRHGKSSCHLALNMLSPPSSDSRRESHTDLSSLARTPNRERVIMPGNDSNGIALGDLKPVIDSAYMDSINTKIGGTAEKKDLSNHLNRSGQANSEIGIVTKPLTNGQVVREDYTLIPAQNPSPLPLSSQEINEPTPLNSKDETAAVTNPDNSSLMNVTVPQLIFNSSSEIHSASSFGSLKFRSRTNTDVVQASSHPVSYHHSLKLPKSPQNLQASVSCSNFSRNDSDMGKFKSSSGGGCLNRDYKSLEWSQHFYAIQKEMDQCIRETRSEKKRESRKSASTKPTVEQEQCSEKPEDKVVPEDTKKDELKPENKTGVLSDSGDSMDDVDTSSENNSELLTIKLYPKSVYMYKLDVNKDSTASTDNNSANETTRIPNGVRKHGFYRRVNSDSDKSTDTLNRVKPSRQSIKKFFRHINTNKHGLKHLISSKTTSNEKKASKVLGIIFGVFVVLWTPFFTANILSVTCSACMNQITPEIMSVFLWMGYVASLANPIIYTMFNTAFRRAFIRILRCYFCKHGSLMNTRSSVPNSYLASVYNERRQTVTMLINNNNVDRIPSDYNNSNYSR